MMPSVGDHAAFHSGVIMVMAIIIYVTMWLPQTLFNISNMLRAMVPAMLPAMLRAVASLVMHCRF